MESRGIACALLICSSVAQADTLRVPSEFVTIQYALDACVPGDVVLVAPGTYDEQITIVKPRVSLMSEVKREAHIRADAPVVWVTSDSVAITGMQIEALTFASGRPGLALIGRDFTVESSTITGGWGGVMVFSSAGRISECLIMKTGAGIQVAGLESEVVIEDTDVLQNASSNLGGGITVVGGGSVTLVNCRVVGNSADIGGGAIYAESSPKDQAARLVLEGCLIQGNSAFHGAAITTTNCQTSLRSCTIVGNIATGGGAILAFGGSPSHPSELRNCIVAFNTGYAMSCIQAATAVSCCDVFGNSNDSICGTDGGGNISADPAFCNLPQNDYYLRAESPCAPANSPPGCDLIGAFAPRCVDLVAPATWGALKHEFYLGEWDGAAQRVPLSKRRSK